MRERLSPESRGVLAEHVVLAPWCLGIGFLYYVICKGGGVNDGALAVLPFYRIAVPGAEAQRLAARTRHRVKQTQRRSHCFPYDASGVLLMLV